MRANVNEKDYFFGRYIGEHERKRVVMVKVTRANVNGKTPFLGPIRTARTIESVK